MTDNKVVTLVPAGQRGASLPPTSLALQVYNQLVNADLLEELDFDAEVEALELSAIGAGERVIGTMTEDERRVFTLEVIVNEVFEEYLRERHADFIKHYAELVGDTSLDKGAVEQAIAKYKTSKEELQIIWQYYHSVAALRMVWSYSVKSRLNHWGITGIRSFWNIVTYEVAGNEHLG